MIFYSMEATDLAGTPLSSIAGVYQANWNNNICNKFLANPVIDDLGKHQNVKLISTILTTSVYSFLNGASEINHVFMSNAVIPVEIQLKRTAQAPNSSFCIIRHTLYYYLIGSDGVRKRKRSSNYIKIR